MTSSAQFLVFDPGLFVLDLVASQTTSTEMGVGLPALRLDPTPPTPSRPGRAVVTGAIESGWIWRTDGSVFVLVTGGQAGMVLTICRAEGSMAPPEIRFRQVQTSMASSAGGPGAAAEAPADAVSVPLMMLAHIRGAGDVTGPGGRWLGKAGSNAPIEGFAITPSSAVAPGDLEYQAILGNNWNTPWFAAGEFCGSRGMLLPLLGLRVRLKGAAADSFECRYTGSFVGAAAAVSAKDGESCVLGDAPLEAIQIVIVKREPVAPPAAKPKPKARTADQKQVAASAPTRGARLAKAQAKTKVKPKPRAK